MIESGWAAGSKDNAGAAAPANEKKKKTFLKMMLLLVAAALMAHGPVVDAFCLSPAYSKVRRRTALQFQNLSFVC